MINKIIQLITGKYKKAASIIVPLGEALPIPREVVVVVDDIKPIVSVDYFELQGELIKAIVVSKNLIVADVYYEVLGGLIASRMTSLTRIVYDKGFWAAKLVEEYKKKVFLRELDFLLSLGEIVLYARIPYEYFPTKNFSMYASVDKSVAEMIAESYSILQNKLLLKMRRDYEYVVKRSIDRHVVSLENGYLRIRDLGVKAYVSRAVKALKSLKEVITPITSQILSVFKGIQGKSRDATLPIIFKYPHIVIELEEGSLALGNWRELLRDIRGEVQRIGKHSFIDSAEIYEVGGDKLVVKQYFALTGLKWVLASIIASISKKFSVLPSERQVNEYKAVVELKKKNLPVRNVVLVDPVAYVTVFEYVEGDSVWKLSGDLQLKAYKLVGEVLASMHQHGFVVGDTKPDNFIYSSKEDQVYVIDLEQSRRTYSVEEQAWDIAMFLYFHALRTITSNLTSALKSFIEGYTSIMGWKPVVEASKTKYMVPFTSIAPIQQLVKIHGFLRTRLS